MRLLALVALALVLSGCAGAPPGGMTPSSSPSPTHLAPKQILSKEGNAQCQDVLSGEARLPFEVEAGYDTIEVTWHASGLGNVGYDILTSDGSKVQGVADSNPGNQPCNHDHEGGAVELMAMPGTYVAVVRNAGVLSWHLLVNEKVSGDPMAEHHH